MRMTDQIIIDVNPAFEELFGFKHGEIVGKTSVALGMHQDLAAREKIVEAFKRDGMVRGMESHVITKSGKKLVIENWINGVEIDGVPHVLTNLRDVTAMRNSEKALERALVTRDEFLSIASHELKTPLTSLKLNAQLQQKMAEEILGEQLSKNKFLEYNEKILRWVSRIERLVEDMLDITRIRTGAMSIKKQPTNVSKLVTDMLNRLNGDHKISLEDLLPEETSINIDPQRMEQVFNNIISNAIKYGLGNAISVELSLSGEFVLFSVEDRGRGISKDKLESIFQIYERAVKGDSVSGLGLGLYISKQLVLAHGGKLEVESAEGKGSKFMVFLPQI